MPIYNPLSSNSWWGGIIYWLLVFVFSIGVVFIGILIAQFTQSLENNAEVADMKVIVRKTEIIRKMDEMLLCFPCVHRCWVSVQYTAWQMASFTSLIICMVNLLQTKQVQGQAEVSLQIF